MAGPHPVDLILLWRKLIRDRATFLESHSKPRNSRESLESRQVDGGRSKSVFWVGSLLCLSLNFSPYRMRTVSSSPEVPRQLMSTLCRKNMRRPLE